MKLLMNIRSILLDCIPMNLKGFKARELCGIGKFSDAEDVLLEAFKIASENQI